MDGDRGSKSKVAIVGDVGSGDRRLGSSCGGCCFDINSNRAAAMEMSNESKIREFLGEKVDFDKDSGMFFGDTAHNGLQHVADIRGWGRIQKLFPDSKEAMKFQDELGAWIADAITKKLQGK